MILFKKFIKTMNGLMYTSSLFGGFEDLNSDDDEEEDEFLRKTCTVHLN